MMPNRIVAGVFMFCGALAFVVLFGSLINALARDIIIFLGIVIPISLVVSGCIASKYDLTKRASFSDIDMINHCRTVSLLADQTVSPIDFATIQEIDPILKFCDEYE